MRNISSNRYSVESLRQQHNTMNLQEAQRITGKLAAYKGQVMQPFNAPVNDFLILPAEQTDFTRMLKEMTDNNKNFTTAIAPYQHNVTVLVCSDSLSGMDKLNHCAIEYFLKVNNIEI